MSVKATRSLCGLSRATCPATDLVIDLATRDSRGVATFRQFRFTFAVDRVGTWNEGETEYSNISSEFRYEGVHPLCEPARVKVKLSRAGRVAAPLTDYTSVGQQGLLLRRTRRFYSTSSRHLRQSLPYPRRDGQAELGVWWKLERAYCFYYYCCYYSYAMYTRLASIEKGK